MQNRFPERRQRVRILTLKNFGLVAIVAVVLLVGANLVSEARRTHHGDYGRLFGREVGKSETVTARKVEVVTEAPVADQTAADPLLLAPAGREQYLETGEINATAPAQAIEARQPLIPQQAPSVAPGRVAIVGDEGGVAIVGTQRPLRGGFGR